MSHCILDFKEKPYVFRCLKCGVTEPTSFPIGVLELAEQADQFNKLHEGCEE